MGSHKPEGLFNISKERKKLIQRIGLAVLLFVFVGSAIIVIYPYLPLIKYYLNSETDLISKTENIEEAESVEEINTNLLIINKIGVRIPIVEGDDESALGKGAWRLPESSEPDQGGNTVITAHRFKYRPPHQETFYLLDKLVNGDIIQVFWEGKEYQYQVVSSYIVSPDSLEALNPSATSIITLITCEPLFSVEKRLIVQGELIIK